MKILMAKRRLAPNLSARLPDAAGAVPGSNRHVDA